MASRAITHRRGRRGPDRGRRRRICAVAFRTPAPIVGVVRTTEIRVAPEVGGQLAAIKVHKGDPCAPAMSSPSCPRSNCPRRSSRRARRWPPPRRTATTSMPACAQKRSPRWQPRSPRRSRDWTMRSSSSTARVPTGAQRRRFAAEPRSGAERRRDRARRRRRSRSQSCRRRCRANARGTRHRGCASQGGGLRARGARAAAGKDHPARAGRRCCQRDRRPKSARTSAPASQCW